MSNDHINELITSKALDFDDEEQLGYLVSLLKTLSLKLDNTSVQFFYNRVCHGFCTTFQ